MIPAQLTAASFFAYPPQARALATQYLDLLRTLPLPLAAILLRDLSSYDWQFPVERRYFEGQLHWLNTLSAMERQSLCSGFAQISLSPELITTNWAAEPLLFSQSMTAYLWSSHQIDAFRKAAGAYGDAWGKAHSNSLPSQPHLCIVILGEGLKDPGHSLFRKLRPHGVFFPQVDSSDSMQAVQELLARRLTKSAESYDHWYIDGNQPDVIDHPSLTRISWQQLTPLRKAILQRMETVVNSPIGGPEQLESMLFRTTLMDAGVKPGNDDLLNHFSASIFTGGSGTQLYSTTFVQWTIREALRRAQPSTLVARFTSRQSQSSINEILAREAVDNVPDAAGSLIDADMGAFYTWINQQRLSGADQALFFAWSQEHRQAVGIGPGLPKGSISSSLLTIKQLLALS